MTTVAEPPRKRGEEETNRIPTNRPPGTIPRVVIGVVASAWALMTAVQITSQPTRGDLQNEIQGLAAHTALGDQAVGLQNRSNETRYRFLDRIGDQLWRRICVTAPDDDSSEASSRAAKSAAFHAGFTKHMG